MDKSFFGMQIDKLRGVYSAAAMNEHRVQLFWDRFKGVENRVFENAVNWLIAEATTQQLPAMSRFAEAVGMFRTNPNGASMQIIAPAHDCEVCRDFGYRFDGDTVIRCPTCYRGREIGPEALAHAQGCYNRGGEFLKRGRSRTGFMADLPYDPSSRIGGGA